MIACCVRLCKHSSEHISILIGFILTAALSGVVGNLLCHPAAADWGEKVTKEKAEKMMAIKMNYDNAISIFSSSVVSFSAGGAPERSGSNSDGVVQILHMLTNSWVCGQTKVAMVILRDRWSGTLAQSPLDIY